MPPLLFHRIRPTLPHLSLRIPRPSFAKYRPSHIQSRTMTSSAPSSSSSLPKHQQPTPPAPRFSHGSDHTASTKALSALLTLSSGGHGGSGRWTLTTDGEGVERMFRFKTFGKTWDFMTAVSLQCKLKNHHPEWSNVFNTTFIRWTTHNPKGLSPKDLELAATCDALARDFGEVVEAGAKDVDAGDSCRLSGLANKAVTGSGDCCK